MTSILHGLLRGLLRGQGSGGEQRPPTAAGPQPQQLATLPAAGDLEDGGSGGFEVLLREDSERRRLGESLARYRGTEVHSVVGGPRRQSEEAACWRTQGGGACHAPSSLPPSQLAAGEALPALWVAPCCSSHTRAACPPQRLPACRLGAQAAGADLAELAGAAPAQQQQQQQQQPERAPAFPDEPPPPGGSAQQQSGPARHLQEHSENSAAASAAAAAAAQGLGLGKGGGPPAAAEGSRAASVLKVLHQVRPADRMSLAFEHVSGWVPASLKPPGLGSRLRRALAGGKAGGGRGERDGKRRIMFDLSGAVRPGGWVGGWRRRASCWLGRAGPGRTGAQGRPAR
jgi:hypothetical protein